LNLRIDHHYKIILKKIDETGGIGSSIWSRVKDLPLQITTKDELNKIPAFLDNRIHIDLTGTWKCNDGAKYYIHQINEKDKKIVWWLGISNAANFANVFRGEFNIEKNAISGEWSDVPTEVAPESTLNYGQWTVDIIKSDSKFDHLKIRNTKHELRKMGATPNWPKQI